MNFTPHPIIPELLALLDKHGAGLARIVAPDAGNMRPHRPPGQRRLLDLRGDRLSQVGPHAVAHPGDGIGATVAREVQHHALHWHPAGHRQLRGQHGVGLAWRDGAHLRLHAAHQYRSLRQPFTLGAQVIGAHVTLVQEVDQKHVVVDRPGVWRQASQVQAHHAELLRRPHPAIGWRPRSDVAGQVALTGEPRAQLGAQAVHAGQAALGEQLDQARQERVVLRRPDSVVILVAVGLAEHVLQHLVGVTGAEGG